MGQMQRVSSNNTAIFTGDDNMVQVILHHTPVVKFNGNQIILNSGGWQTVTTKARMNQASNQFSLGYMVFQKDFDWFVSFNGENLEFNDGMILHR